MSEDAILSSLIASLAKTQGDEILLNGIRGAFVVVNGKTQPLANPFDDSESMIQWIQTLAYRSLQRIDPLFPSNGGTIDQVWRWHGVLPPAAPNGPIFCLRRQRLNELDMEDFEIELDSVAKIEQALQSQRPILVCGPTGSGKTSLLAALLKKWCKDERVCLLERIQEIPTHSPHWISLVERPANQEGCGAISLQHLFEEALRLLPQRIVVGEIRGAEVGPFFHSTLTGHGSVISSFHGTHPTEVMERLSTLLCPILHADRVNAHAALRQLNPQLLFVHARGAKRFVTAADFSR